MSTFVDNVIRLIFQLIVVFGIWRMIKPIVDRQISLSDSKRDLRKNLKKQRDRTLKIRKGIYKHLDDLLYLVQKGYEPGASVTKFLIRSIFMFIGIFLLSFLLLRGLPALTNSDISFLQNTQTPAKESWQFPFYLAILAAVIPYLQLRYRYSIRQAKGSYDLLEVVKIYAKYCYLSIDVALHRTSEFLREDNVLRDPLKSLAEAFANYRTTAELNEEAARFTRAVSTTFASNFVSDLLNAEREGTHFLNASLLDLNQAMETQRETIMDVKSNNRDAVSLGLWVNLFTFICCVGSFMFLVNPKVYFKLQFQTTIGLTFLVIIISSFFAALIMSVILARPKLDYM
ncbi:hypothetical protein BSK66_27700 [Paenibacillus odorifer]|uniref:hypothetical protein n=1 Tax=Paenibacillus TaxID=44249 RepID=UPI0003E1F065|nr:MULTISPECIES: hypothetical protein [Paenibacillus]ETT61292.1 hypothetical protein C171_12548 [Paenibacillus sp. FSL H8-237]OMD13742.1 hypothetical protein BJP47_24250 [Paenibacillus odorifer]OME48972.1 hypothetical protein BSK66_27700 [Paenibacillus odorifer]